MSFLETNTICRLCLNECENAVSIFADNNSLLELIRKFLFLKIEADDMYSTNICPKCCNILEEFHNYYQCVYECQITLQTIQASIKTGPPEASNEYESVQEQKINQDLKKTDERKRCEIIYETRTQLDEDPVTNDSYSEFLSLEDGNFSFEILDAAADEDCTYFEDSQKNSETTQEKPSTSNEPIICNACLVGFATHESYERHFFDTECKDLVEEETISTKGMKSQAIPVCSKVNTIILKRTKQFEGNESLEHKRCHICPSVFDSQTAVDEHIARSHNEEEQIVKHLTCQKCPKTFSHIRAKNAHMRYYHDASYETVKDRTCPICSKVASSIQKLKVHISLSHNHKPFSCKFCNKSFITRAERQEHAKNFHPEFPGNTQRDDESLPETVTQTSSMSKNTRNYPAEIEKANTLEENDIEYRICAICSKTYLSAEVLKKHTLNVHPKTFPFKCKVCKEKFALKLLFHQHLKLYKENCEKAPDKVYQFKKANYQQSLDRKDRKRPRQIQKIEHRSCVVCNKTFFDKFCLKRHMQRAHANIKPFFCSHCEEKFLMLDEFEKHVLDVSSNCKNDQQQERIKMYRNRISASLNETMEIEDVSIQVDNANFEEVIISSEKTISYEIDLEI